ncbi:MAG: hypothetical protein RLZZ459_2378, partial [Cyanobacteriota bacterium]
ALPGVPLLSGVQDQLGPLRAWLFPRRVHLHLEDQAITALALDGEAVRWLERVPLPQGLCVDGQPRQMEALADLLGDLLVERGFTGASITATLPPAAAQVRLVRWSSGRLPQDPDLLLARQQGRLGLSGLWHDLDLQRRDLEGPGQRATSLVVSTPSALLESWISLFNQAAVRLDRIEAVQLCLCRALQPLRRQAGAGRGLSFVLQLESWGSTLLVVDGDWPVFQRLLPSIQDPAALLAGLQRCWQFLQQLWPDRGPSPELFLYGGDLLDPTQTDRLAAALGWPCQRLDVFERGWLQDATVAGASELGGVLLPLWGLVMTEQHR